MNRRSPTCVLLLLTWLAAPVSVGAAGDYYVVHFSTGPAWNEELPPGEQTGFREHSANLNRMREADVIVFGARYDEYGMLVVRAASADDAAELFADDPGVLSGIFEYRVAKLSVFYPWREDSM